MNNNTTLKNVSSTNNFISSTYIQKYTVIHAILVLCMISQAATLLQVVRRYGVVLLALFLVGFLLGDELHLCRQKRLLMKGCSQEVEIHFVTWSILVETVRPSLGLTSSHSSLEDGSG